MFAGSDVGGDNIADAMTLIETAKMSGLNPEAYLADVLAQYADWARQRVVVLRKSDRYSGVSEGFFVLALGEPATLIAEALGMNEANGRTD